MSFKCSICDLTFDDSLVVANLCGHKICSFCVTAQRTQQRGDKDSDGVKLLYLNADLHDNKHLKMTGKQAREIIALLETDRFKSDQNIATVVVIDGKGNTRLFVPEKDR